MTLVAFLAIVLACSGAVQGAPAHAERRTGAPPYPYPYDPEAQKLADPNYGPIPGESDIYNSYWGLDRPFPGNITSPIFPTKYGPPGVDDWTWQNLLSAEWLIFEFYQQGVERFSEEDFVKVGLPNTTHRRLLEIRNNEAGHLRIFQNQISPYSVKPGPCKYVFPFSEPLGYLALMTVLEISSMAFLTGLVQQPQNPAGRGAMVAIAEVETRHEVWALLDIWKTNPFGGPSDTVFPYANEVLDTTNAFITVGSCPKGNPEYPHPRQKLPALSAGKDTASLTPGSSISLDFTDPNNQPRFHPHIQYYAVFFHGVLNVSVPINVTSRWPREQIRVTIPKWFETKGVIVAVVADRIGAPTKESIVAGPGIILEQPAKQATELLHGARAGAE
ncbi:hypothetical protein V8F20_011018 [Naviculisporaceae sp. PSN 640]